MGDTTIEDALIRASHRGVGVRVCGENTSGEYDSDFSRLARAGVHISYYSSSHGFYIHGKVIEADYGTSHARVFIGSENFSAASLQPQPRTRADHRQPDGDVLDRRHLRR